MVSVAGANAFADYAKLAVLDLDGDARPDVFATLYAESPVGIVMAFLAPADPMRQPWRPVVVDRGPIFGGHSLAVASFDGTARLQIVVAETNIGGWDFGVDRARPISTATAGSTSPATTRTRISSARTGPSAGGGTRPARLDPDRSSADNAGAMRAAVALSIGLLAAAAPAHALTAHLITGTSLVDLTPGSDLRIGTGDDGTMSGPIPPSASGPNVHGAASFALLNESGTVPTGLTFDHILFVDGTIQFTPDYGASTADTLVLRIDAGTLRSTAEFGYPGRGEATTTLTGGTTETDLSARSASARLTGTFAPPAGGFPLNDETLTSAPGFTTIVLRPMFGASGDNYIDHILTPLVPANATAIICVEFTGTVTSPGCCQGFTTHGVLTAYTSDDLGCADVFPELCGPATCASFAACAVNLASTLPDPIAAASPKARRVARRLGQLATKAGGFYRHATASGGKKRTRFYGRTATTLRKLLAVATAANGKGILGVPLDAIVGALNLLLGQIPGS